MLKQLITQLCELGEYFSYYVTAKTDSVKLSLRTVVLRLGLTALGFVAVGGLIVIASWFVLSGIAEGLGALFGDRLWLGNITTGFLLLAGLGLGMYYTAANWEKTSRERTVRKYEKRQARQQAHFGRSVGDHAATSSQKNEQSFLADQTADAKTAVAQTLHDMKETVEKVADVRSCTRRHPWLVIGSAVASGFATGAALIPVPRKNIKKTRATSQAVSQPSCPGQETPRTKTSFLSIVVTLVVDLLQTVVQVVMAPLKNRRR